MFFKRKNNAPPAEGNKPLGARAEALAVKYLKKCGFKILETNKTYKFGEADIIAMDGATLVFVEVKYRTTDYFGRPEEAVNFRKQQTYLKIAKVYSAQPRFANYDIRFDIVAVLGKEITHIKNAFTG